jgi:hypothetical protein
MRVWATEWPNYRTRKHVLAARAWSAIDTCGQRITGRQFASAVMPRKLSRVGEEESYDILNKSTY